MHIQRIKSEECIDWLLYKHYAKRMPPVSFCFGLYEGSQLVGVCTYGPPARMLNDGYGAFDGKIKVGTFELNRLCINDGMPKNTLSFFVSKTIKDMPKFCLLVSYADENSGHHGYIYQATNWIYTGITAKETVYYNEYNGKTIHPRTIVSEYGTREEKSLPNYIKIGKEKKGKHRYLFLRGSKKQIKEMKRFLKYPVLEYPKGNNERYDSSFKVATQELLF